MSELYHFVQNDFVYELLNHAYGQRDAVVDPGPKANKDLVLKNGPLPAGVTETLLHLYETYRTWDGQHLHWLFLVGGPGNGKSKALNEFAAMIGIALQPPNRGTPVERVIRSSNVLQQFDARFIHDASIPYPQFPKGGALLFDLAEALSSLTDIPVILFGNINRGVLVEEFSTLEESTNILADRFAPDVLAVSGDTIKWLLNPRRTGEQISHLLKVQCTPSRVQPYYAQAIIPVGAESTITIHALYLDTLSLIEPTPLVEGSQDTIQFTSGVAPAIGEYRPCGKLDAYRESIAEERVRKVSAQELWDKKCTREGKRCDAYSLCPFVQNSVWLRNPDLRQKYLGVLRAAEVIASRRFTYRDFLGHLALSILGEVVPEWQHQDGHPCDWVHRRVEVLNGDRQDAAQDHALALVELISHRIYANIFSTQDAATWIRIGGNSQIPLHRAINSVRKMKSGATRTSAWEAAFNRLDPARDAADWQRDILDALDAAQVVPATEALSSIASFGQSVGQLEHMLDEAFQADLPQMKSQQAQVVWHWRSVLLMRHYGMALGYLAFKDVIDAWLREHLDSLDEFSTGTRIRDGLKRLVVGQQSDVVIAPLRARTMVLKDLPPKTLGISIPTPQIQVRTLSDGDTLLARVQITGDDEPIAEFPVDFDVAREAFLLGPNSGERTDGFTEVSPSTFARIERARAVLASRQNLRKPGRTQILYRGEAGSPEKVKIQHNRYSTE